jgi:hypothetical protein
MAETWQMRRRNRPRTYPRHGTEQKPLSKQRLQKGQSSSPAHGIPLLPPAKHTLPLSRRAPQAHSPAHSMADSHVQAPLTHSPDAQAKLQSPQLAASPATSIQIPSQTA